MSRFTCFVIWVLSKSGRYILMYGAFCSVLHTSLVDQQRALMHTWFVCLFVGWLVKQI